MTGAAIQCKHARYHKYTCTRATLFISSPSPIIGMPTFFQGTMACTCNTRQIGSHSSRNCGIHKGNSTSTGYNHSKQPSLATTQALSMLEELECPICLDALKQPIQLSCGRLICAICLIQWVQLTASRCPFCYNSTPLECTQVKPAPKLILMLLN